MKIRTIAAILQQSEYDPRTFQEWYVRHQHDSQTIEPDKETAKYRLIVILLSVLFFVPMVTRVKMVLALVHGGEWLVRQVIYSLAQAKLASLRKQGLKIVAVAGSYAKTSTKTMIAESLADQFSILITPRSINTPLGIAQVILHELKKSHQVFVVELGEYYRGDIKALAQFIQPDFGIVTPVGRQHLERMGSIEVIAATVGELAEYFSNPDQVLVAEVTKSYLSNFSGAGYGTTPTAKWRVKNASVSRSGTEFDLQDPHGEHHVFMPLYGEHQAVNLLPSFWLADQLKADKDQLIRACANLSAVSRRHEPTFLDHDILLLDNSYNTNPDSIKASLKLFEQLQPTHRILVTMGFVELGDESEKIHTELGAELAKKIDYLGLLETPQTAWIKAGWIKAGGSKTAVTTGKSAEDVLQHMQAAIVPGSVIILEGGYKELYS